ncbi:type VI secretion system ATPase TssH, partial [Pectobacterium brasiliense]|nr:type VI secretion system ATPase TssH [Pectobacterium brasiliense]
MIRIELPTLVERLNPVCRHMLEEAAALCIQHQGAEIRIEHLLMKMLETPLCDVRQILKRAGVDADELSSLLLPSSVDKEFDAGYPSFSPLLVEWLQDSWLLASAEFQHVHLRSGILLLVLLLTPNRYVAGAISRPLAQINRELLRQQFDEWVKDSVETEVAVQSATAEQAIAASTQLSRYTQNVTESARQGQLDPVLCRDHEIDLMIDILSRRRKNNPIVVGEAGVGKSALIEGLALRIVAGAVPERLRDVELLTLDLG